VAAALSLHACLRRGSLSAASIALGPLLDINFEVQH
jgi:hypothetical protein